MKQKTAAWVLLSAFVVISLGLLLRRVLDLYPPEIYVLTGSIALSLTQLKESEETPPVSIESELATVGASRFEVQTETPELYRGVYWPKTWFNLFDARVFVEVNLQDGRPVSFDLHTIVRPM